MAPMQQSDLCPPVRLITDAPFPEFDAAASKAENRVVVVPSSTKKIVIDSSSELLSASVPTSVFRTAEGDNSAIDIVHDGNGHPMIFSVGSDGRLYCILQVDKAKHPWQLVDITPPGTETKDPLVSAFDVLEIGDNLHIAVSLKGSSADGSTEETHIIYWASVARPKVFMSDAGVLEGFQAAGESQTSGSSFSTSSDIPGLKWTAIANNLGSRVITKLMCGRSVEGTFPFNIFAATQTTSAYLASAYVVHPVAEKPWETINFPTQATKIVDMQPAVVGSATGTKRVALAILHDAPSASGGLRRAINVISLNEKQNEAFVNFTLDTDVVENAAGIWTSDNSWKSTDVLVAGKGIAFHEFQNLNTPVLDTDNQIVLPDVSFRQVVCKETMLSNPRRYLLSLLAISEDDELYFIEGERDPQKRGLPTFKYSGLPIRTNVAQIACHFNRELSTTEFIYTTKSDNQIFHLARDPSTSMWVSTDLQVQGPSTITKKQMYATTLTLSDGEGNYVPEGYPVSLTSEPIFVKINDLHYRLDGNRQTTVQTSSTGQIEILAEAPSQLGMSDIELSLSRYLENPVVKRINLAARSMAAMSSIKSKDDLKSIQSANGKPLFAGIDENKLDAATQLLTNFDTLRNAAENGGHLNSQHSDTASMSSETTLVDYTAQDPEEKNLTKAEHKSKSWLSNAGDTTVEFLGDAVEFLRTCVKKVVRFGAKVVGTVLRFVLVAGSKMVSFVVKNTVTLVRTVVGFLDNTFGLNLGEWLCLNMGDEIIKIQGRAKELILGCITLTTRFIEVNKSSMIDLFDDAEELLFGSIQKKEPKTGSRPSEKILNAVRAIMDHPVVKLILKFNPLQWIMEAISEGLGDAMPDFEMPDFSQLANALGSTATELLKLTLDVFIEISDSIFGGISDALSDPTQLIPIIVRTLKKVFRDAFTTTREAITTIFDGMLKLLQSITSVITGTWSIPGLTDLWEDWTDQKFSLMNYASYGIGIFMYLVSKSQGCSPSILYSWNLPRNWTEVEIVPVYRSCRDKIDQEKIALYHPPPSLPEHTNPLVMMTFLSEHSSAVSANDISKQKEEEAAAEARIKRHEEDEETVHLWHAIELWLTCISGVFRTCTTTVEFKEAALQHKINQLTKEGLLTSGMSVVQFTAAMIVSHHTDNPDEQASGLQTSVTAVGLIVSLIGNACDGIGSLSKHYRNDWGLLTTATICFNLGSAAQAAFTPGVWSWDDEVKGEEVFHTFGSICGLSSVLVMHYAREQPWGPPASMGLIIGDWMYCTAASLIAGAEIISHLTKH